jgi:hypothetical protein
MQAQDTVLSAASAYISVYQLITIFKEAESTSTNIIS